METVVTAVCRSCSCDEESAREYIEHEVNYLNELLELEDFRDSDIESACENLGIDLEFSEYFMSRLA